MQRYPDYVLGNRSPIKKVEEPFILPQSWTVWYIHSSAPLDLIRFPILYNYELTEKHSFTYITRIVSPYSIYWDFFLNQKDYKILSGYDIFTVFNLLKMLQHKTEDTYLLEKFKEFEKELYSSEKEQRKREIMKYNEYYSSLTSLFFIFVIFFSIVIYRNFY